MPCESVLVKKMLLLKIGAPVSHCSSVVILTLIHDMQMSRVVDKPLINTKTLNKRVCGVRSKNDKILYNYLRTSKNKAELV